MKRMKEKYSLNPQTILLKVQTVQWDAYIQLKMI